MDLNDEFVNLSTLLYEISPGGPRSQSDDFHVIERDRTQERKSALCRLMLR